MAGGGSPVVEEHARPDAGTDELERRKREPPAEVSGPELRCDAMQAAIGILGKGTGGDPADVLANRERALVTNSLRDRCRLCGPLDAVGLKRPSHRCRMDAIGVDRHAGARPIAPAAFDADGETHGRRGIHGEIAADDAIEAVVGERRMGRMLRDGGPAARGREGPKRDKPCRSCRGGTSGRPGDKVRQGFRAGLPSLPWLTGVTQLTTPAGKPCLSPFLDCLDGAMASRTASRPPNAEMANSMLGAALSTTTASERRHLVTHSDAGCHHRWPEWMSICNEAGIARSMPRRGCTPDNQRMEAFFGTMRTEMSRKGDWKDVSPEGLEDRINRYLARYSTTRRKRSLGGMSPIQYRRSLNLAA